MELFRRYPQDTPPGERKGAPVCVASYPAPCGEPAVGEGWGCLPFCEAHWREAEMAAREELSETVEKELEVLTDAEDERFDRNAAVVRALRGASVPGLSWELADYDAQDAALAAAFPPGRIEGKTAPETLAFDYDRHYAGDGPVEWWSDACTLLLRFRRQSGARGLPVLTLELEALRERATVQRELAKADYELRYVADAERQAERQAERREGGSDA